MCLPVSPLPAPQLHLPLTIKDLITICKKGLGSVSDWKLKLKDYILERQYLELGILFTFCPFSWNCEFVFWHCYCWAKPLKADSCSIISHLTFNLVPIWNIKYKSKLLVKLRGQCHVKFHTTRTKKLVSKSLAIKTGNSFLHCNRF